MPGRRRSQVAGESAGRLPDFVIIGAMRAGSTTLARTIGMHPMVHMPAKKELHFFDWNWDRGIEWYRAHFRDAKSGELTGEATPIYVVYREAMERMAATIPHARFLIVLRNPVDRAYSHYWYNRMLDFERLPFDEALATEASRPSRVTDKRTFDYVARGRYLAQLRRVTELFPRESLHVVILEELNRDPISSYRAVFEFLHVDDSFVPPALGVSLNSHAVYRSRLIAKVSRGLPGSLRRATRRLNRRETPYEPMDPAIRRSLEERFALDNEALAEWLGRDLSVWAPAPGLQRPAPSAKAE
jgi:hypothetical protein